MNLAIAEPTEALPKGLSDSNWSGIRLAYERQRHAVAPVEGGFEARNPGQQWRIRFDGRGFVTQPDAAAWQWGLELDSFGFSEHEHVVENRPTRVQADGGRVAYDWDSTLQEWFVNEARGFEHGFTVNTRPSVADSLNQPATLNFLLSVRGGLQPEVQADGTGVNFVDAEGNTAVTYDGLTVLDANGQKLPSWFEALADSKLLRIVVDERGARYPLTVDPFARQAYLKASNTGAGDYFGQSVAISGNTVVVGAIFEDSNATGINGNQSNNLLVESGAAYVFVRNGNTWTQQAYLKASNTGASDEFGYSVAISGDTVVVGTVFEDSNATGVNGNQGDNSAGASGAAYVFVRNGTTWSQQAYLKANNTGAGDRFGESVSVSGDTIVVGAYREDSNATGVDGDGSDNSAVDSGGAYVFVRGGTNWAQQAYLKASNTGAGDYFGESVAVSGDTVVVGAEGEDSNATGVNGNASDDSAAIAGAAYVFVREGTNWSQQAYLKASNTESADSFGFAVAISDDTVLVGSLGEDSSAGGVNGNQNNNNASGSGAAYVFVRDGMNWSQQAYLKATSSSVSANFGKAVAISDDTAVIGAPENFSLSGSAHIFTRTGTNWSHQSTFFDNNINPVETDLFGRSVAASGNTVVVGQPLEDSNATGVNGNEFNSSLANSGAAFVFVTPRAQLNLLVDIDATALAEGPLTSVANNGTMGGFFEARGGGTTIPVVVAADGGGTVGIRFDGGDYLQHVTTLGGPVLPANAYLVGVPSCTIEAWVLNGAVDQEETIVSWGKRGGPNGSNFAFNYGWSAGWGAIGHWGPADLGWTSGTDGGGTYGAGVPPSGVWHHLVCTFDAGSQRVYADGVFKNSEIVSLNIASGPPITIAAQTDANGSTVTATLRGSFTLGRLRIYDGALTESQIATNYALAANTFTNGPGALLVSGPIHRYRFENPAGAATSGSTVFDLVGTAHGTVFGSGGTFTGSRLTFSGGSWATAAYVDLPDGLLSANSTNNGGTGEATVEGWARVTGNQQWSRLFDFGSSSGGQGQDHFVYTAQMDTNVYGRWLEVKNADAVGGTGGGGNVNHGSTSYGKDFHYAVTWNDSTGEMRVYENGAFVISRTETARLSQLNDTNVWLGRSQWTSNPNLQGQLDELRIYDRVLSEAELRGSFLRGPDNVSGQLTIFNVTGSGAQCGSVPVGLSGSEVGVIYLLQTNAVYAGVAVEGTGASISFGNQTVTAIYSVVGSNTTLAVTEPMSGSASVIVIQPPVVGGEPPTCTSAPSNLVAFWRGDNGATDSAGTKNGALSGAVTFNACAVGSAGFTFNTLGSHVSMPFSPAVQQTNLTVEGWIFAQGTPATQAGILGTWNDLGGVGTAWRRSYLMWSYQGKLEFLCGAGGTIDSATDPAALPINTWIHVAGTYDGTTIRLYRNGTQVTSKAYSGILNTNDQRFYIGRTDAGGDGSDYWRGMIDDVSVYSRALSSNEIAAIYAAGSAGKCLQSPTLAISPISTNVFTGDSVNLSASDGQPPYQFTIATNNSGGIIDTNTGAYTAGSTAGTDTVSVSDALGSNALATVVVSASNTRPRLANPIPDTNGIYGTPLSFEFAANSFTDLDAGQTLIHSALGLPPEITFTPATRTFSGTPTNVGTISVTVTATDNGSPALSTNDVFDIVIAKAPITATADDKSRGYAETNPPLTFSYAGFVLGETESVLDTPPTASTTATNGSPIGSYPITLSGGADDHYAFSYATGTLSITTSALTVWASNASCAFGIANPALTGSLVGVAWGDNITATFSTTATPSSPPGTYPITPTLQDPASKLVNYSVTTNAGTLTVEGVTLEFTLSAGSPNFCWPTNAEAFILEYTDSLAPPVTWYHVMNGITTNSAGFCFIATPEAAIPSRFYRLRLP